MTKKESCTVCKGLGYTLSGVVGEAPIECQACIQDVAPAGPVAWTPGPNVFKDWCNQWFGPDADDDYLAKAVFALPPVAQRFSEPAQPIDMVLHCPNCGKQHIDAPEGQFIPGFTADETVAYNEHYKLWTNPPHRSHLCHGCSCIWRPADVPTNGVESIKTDGKADTWPTHAEEVRAQPAPQALSAPDSERAARAKAMTAAQAPAQPAEAVAWEYRNQHGNPFLSHTDPHKWHPHDQEGFGQFRALVYAAPSQPDRAVMQQALDALEYHVEQTRPIERSTAAIAALRAALSATMEKP